MNIKQEAQGILNGKVRGAPTRDSSPFVFTNVATFQRKKNGAPIRKKPRGYSTERVFEVPPTGLVPYL